MTLQERTAQKRVPEHWLPLRFGPHMWVAWLGQGRGRTIVEQGSRSFGRGSNAGYSPLARISGMLTHLQLPNAVILMTVFSYLRVGAACDRQVKSKHFLFTKFLTDVDAI